MLCLLPLYHCGGDGGDSVISRLRAEMKPFPPSVLSKKTLIPPPPFYRGDGDMEAAAFLQRRVVN